MVLIPFKNYKHGSDSSSGIPSLWTRISASVLRQTIYSTTRFGLYNYLATNLKHKSGTAELSAASTMTCAGVAGGIAGIVGNPTEVSVNFYGEAYGLGLLMTKFPVSTQVVLVRMCTDGVKAPEQKYRYRNALIGLLRIAKDEGVGTFSKGIGPNVIRSVLMSKST